jgi:succinyl-CoA synthetase beta subunit
MLMQASGDIAMLIAAARAQCRNVLSEPEAKAFLRAQGISVSPGRAVSHAEEAPAVVRELGVPVVVKAVAHQLTHKTDVGAVMLPVIMFGLGGIYVETLRQVSFRLAPLCDRDIEALLSERPAMQLLSSARGPAPADRRAVVDVLRRLSDLSQQPLIVRDVSEIEINPLAATENGALALDALIVLHS